jgi:type 1 glutamine amidotransferase
VGVHSATDTLYTWSWYGALVGTYFADHPAVQSATLRVVDGAQPGTRMLPRDWVRTDEWYNFRAPPDGVRVLIELDETTYQGGTMGLHHPWAWSHEYAGGRAFYTAGGHTKESYREPLFLAHLAGGIQYAAGSY